MVALRALPEIKNVLTLRFKIKNGSPNELSTPLQSRKGKAARHVAQIRVFALCIEGLLSLRTASLEVAATKGLTPRLLSTPILLHLKVVMA